MANLFNMFTFLIPFWSCFIFHLSISFPGGAAIKLAFLYINFIVNSPFIYSDNHWSYSHPFFFLYLPLNFHFINKFLNNYILSDYSTQHPQYSWIIDLNLFLQCYNMHPIPERNIINSYFPSFIPKLYM